MDTTAEDVTAEDATAELSSKGWTLRRSHQILILPWTLRRRCGGFLVVLLLKHSIITRLLFYLSITDCYVTIKTLLSVTVQAHLES